MRRFRPIAKPVIINDKIFYWIKHNSRDGRYCLWSGTWYRYLMYLYGYAEVDCRGTFSACIMSNPNSYLNKADDDPFRYSPAYETKLRNLSLRQAMNTVEDHVEKELLKLDEHDELIRESDRQFYNLVENKKDLK